MKTLNPLCFSFFHSSSLPALDGSRQTKRTTQESSLVFFPMWATWGYLRQVGKTLWSLQHVCHRAWAIHAANVILLSHSPEQCGNGEKITVDRLINRHKQPAAVCLHDCSISLMKLFKCHPEAGPSPPHTNVAFIVLLLSHVQSFPTVSSFSHHSLCPSLPLLLFVILIAQCRLDT